MLGNELPPLVDEPRLGNEATGSLTSLGLGSVTRSYGLVDEPLEVGSVTRLLAHGVS